MLLLMDRVTHGRDLPNLQYLPLKRICNMHLHTKCRFTSIPAPAILCTNNPANNGWLADSTVPAACGPVCSGPPPSPVTNGYWGTTANNNCNSSVPVGALCNGNCNE